MGEGPLSGEEAFVLFSIFYKNDLFHICLLRRGKEGGVVGFKKENRGIPIKKSLFIELFIKRTIVKIQRTFERAD